MCNIKHKNNYHIVPFKYGGNLNDTINMYNLGGDISKIWMSEMNTSPDYLLSYVSELTRVSEDKKNKGKIKLGCSTIGVCFRLNLRNSNLIKYGIPPEEKSEKVLCYEKSKFNFIHKFIKVYLFETGVGFLVYSIDFLVNDVDNLIEANNSFKKYNHSNSYESLEKVKEYKVDKIEREKKKIKVNNEVVKKHESDLEAIKEYVENEKKVTRVKRSTIVKELIETLGVTVEDFFTKTNEPDYSHMLTYLVLPKESSDESIGKYLYSLKHGVKESCKPSEFDLQLERTNGNIRLYENFWWGIAIEGVTCICKETEDARANSFAESYKGTIENVHLYAYILMLHMRYALLNYITKASTVSKNILSEENNEEDIEALNMLQKDIIQFDFRGIFNELFNLTPYINIFDEIKNRLRINQLNSELQYQINNLSKLANLYEDKLEQKKNKRIEKSIQIIGTILAGLAISTFVRDSVESIEGVFWGEIESYYILVPTIPTVVVLIALLIQNRNVKSKIYKVLMFILILIVLLISTLVISTM